MSKKQFQILIAVIVSCYLLQTLFLFYKFHGAQEYNYKAYDELLHISQSIESMNR